MRFGALVKIAAAALLGVCGASASAQNWDTITQNGGYKVARVTMSGAATGIGLTCERGVAVIAVNLTRSPRRNPALLTLKNGAASGALPIIRNGATNVWAGVIKDARLLDGLATGQSVGIAVDGADYGTASLAGANAAMRTALAGCWRPQMAGSANSMPGGTTAPPAAKDPDEQYVRRDIARIFGYSGGKQLADRYYRGENDWPQITPRLQALFGACNRAVEAADGERAYNETGDQGCREGDISALDGIGNYADDEVPFIKTWSPVIKRMSPDLIEAELIVPARYATAEMAKSVTYRYRKSGGSWRIDDVGHRYGGRIGWLSEDVGKITTTLNKLPRKRRR